MATHQIFNVIRYLGEESLVVSRLIKSLTVFIHVTLVLFQNFFLGLAPSTRRILNSLLIKISEMVRNKLFEVN